MSIESISTVSTLESELDEPTIPTTWTPDSSPGANGRKVGVTIRDLSLGSDRDEKSIELTRVTTFGEKEMGSHEKWRMEAMPRSGHVPGRNSVGVAF